MMFLTTTEGLADLGQIGGISRSSIQLEKIPFVSHLVEIVGVGNDGGDGDGGHLDSLVWVLLQHCHQLTFQLPQVNLTTSQVQG